MRSLPRMSLLLALALSWTPCALAQWIDLPGTQPHDLDSTLPLAPASDCTACHGRGDPEAASAFMPGDTWVGSMMANAVRDPLFLAALTIAEQDRPGIGDFCLRCHSPSAFTAGRTRASALAGLGTTPPLLPPDSDGVTCDACHRMTSAAAPGNGQYVYSTSDVRFAQYADSVSMRHGAGASTFTSGPALCGTCHELANPLVHRRALDGSDTGEPMPLDTTYSEWAASAFARTGTASARDCEDCHMPRSPVDGFVSTEGGSLRTTPERHDFAGGNVWGILLVRDTRADPALAPFYDLAALRARQMLESAAALEITTAPADAAPGDTVHVATRIENRAGHKLPTGYADGRRVWLEVALIDARGVETVVSGRYDAAEGLLDTSDPQLRVYEAVHGRVGVGPEEHLALHDTVVRDTRIPAREMVASSAIAPVERDYAGGAGGALRNDDSATYAIDIPRDASGTLTVRVRAMYQSTTRAYVDFLARENHTDNRGLALRSAWVISGRAAPIAMASTTVTLGVRAPGIADAGPVDAPTVADAGMDARLADEGTSRPTGCTCRAAGHPARRTHVRWALCAMISVVLVARRRPRRPIPPCRRRAFV